MRLSVKNLGPLGEAEVDLSQPLIILAGPNNTGKTWFSWCVYGVHVAKALGPDSTLEGNIPEEIFSEEGADLSLLIQQNRHLVVTRIATDTRASLPPLFASEPELFENTEVALIEDSLASDEMQIQAVRQNLLTNRRMTVAYSDEEITVFLRIHNGRYKLRSGRRLKVQEDGVEADEEPITQINQLNQERRERLKEGVRRAVFRTLTRSLLPSCTIFPAERIAVNIFARELSLKRSELVDDMLDVEGNLRKSARQAALLNRRARRYPWPIRDSLRIADDLSFYGRRKGQFADLATDLETSVMGGKIGISKQGDMTFSPSQAPERALGIHLTASVVKSLSSLVFYFRYLANAGDFLIIDEPELNLHPDNQRRVARVLAKAVNRGFKIMLSTHSDCLIREFNHLIMLSQDSDVARELRQRFEYEESSLLTPDKVGVYLFNEDHATPIPVREDGFEVKTIDDEINKMNFVTQTLYVRLFD